MKSVVVCAWSLASDTDLMLGWIFNTKLVDPNKFLTADADEVIRQKMEEFEKKYQKKARASEKERERWVQNYLGVQRKTLLEIGEKLLEGRPKTPPESDDESSRSVVLD